MPYIFYKLITNKYYSPYDSCQCSDFSSMIKRKGRVYVDTHDPIYFDNNISFDENEKYIYKWELKDKIAKKAGIPSNTIIDIYTYSQEYINESKNYIPTQNNILYYLDCIKPLEYYAYVDLSKNTIFNNINRNTINSENDKKYLENKVKNLNSTINNLNNESWKTNQKINKLINQNEKISSEKEKLKQNLQNLENKYNNLQSTHREQISNLNNENYNLKRRFEEKTNQMNEKNQKLEKNMQSLEDQNKNIKVQYEYLKTENESNKNQLDNLKKKQNEEENKKIEKKKNLENYRNTFNKDKVIIQNKNIQESKTYIISCIINKFVKEYEIPDNNKKFFKSMKKFTNEFMDLCNKFKKSFTENSRKIISEYKVNENKLKIEHINFIVIGSAGVGKSSLINEILKLEGNQKAKEGKGQSVTEKSTLYYSEKFNIRMWDTQGLDNKITQAYILKEIQRLVEDSLKKGPDFYINIILYCRKGDRFQNDEAQLIYEIMKLYPMDNLPVIITQLQAYLQEDSEEMEKVIREILSNYLENKIVNKIEITSIIARDKIDKNRNITYKARGIPELLRSSFDIMGRAITSATFKKFSQDIEDLCRNFVDKKIEYLQQRAKDEMQLLDISKDYYMDDFEKYFSSEERPKRTLPKYNIYSSSNDKSYFYNNFKLIMSQKFLDIFNNLNNTNHSIDDKEKPLILNHINITLETIKEILNKNSKMFFEKDIYEKIYQKFFTDLRKQQCIRSKEFKTSNQIIDEDEIEKNFKEELFIFFQNEFFKYFICIMIKIFMHNLKHILINEYQKELKENEAMTKIINEKAESSLKYVTHQLKEKLLVDLEKYFPQKKEIKNNESETNLDMEF